MHLHVQGHLVVEALLVVVISALLFQRSFKPISRKGDDLTDKVLCLPPEPPAHPRPLLTLNSGPRREWLHLVFGAPPLTPLRSTPGSSTRVGARQSRLCGLSCWWQAVQPASLGWQASLSCLASR